MAASYSQPRPTAPNVPPGGFGASARQGLAGGVGGQFERGARREAWAGAGAWAAPASLPVPGLSRAGSAAPRAAACARCARKPLGPS